MIFGSVQTGTTPPPFFMQYAPSKKSSTSSIAYILLGFIPLSVTLYTAHRLPITCAEVSDIIVLPCNGVASHPTQAW